MSVAFYMDANVSRHITDGLRRRGVDVLTAQEDGAETLADPELLQRATQLRRVLFTHDKDFHRIAAGMQDRSAHFHGIIYAHLVDVGIGRCIADLEVMAKASDDDDFADRIERLPF